MEADWYLKKETFDNAFLNFKKVYKHNHMCIHVINVHLTIPE